MEKIIKAGSVELTEAEAFQIYEKNKYIVSYSGIFQPFYSNAQRTTYFNKISNIKGLARRGRFYIMDGATINHILGYKLLIEY